MIFTASEVYPDGGATSPQMAETVDVERSLRITRLRRSATLLYVNADKPRGQCPVCTGDFRLKKDGTLWNHNGDVYFGGWRQVCKGAGSPPRGSQTVSAGQ